MKLFHYLCVLVDHTLKKCEQAIADFNTKKEEPKQPTLRERANILAGTRPTAPPPTPKPRVRKSEDLVGGIKRVKIRKVAATIEDDKLETDLETLFSIIEKSRGKR